MSRKAHIERKTKETQIRLKLELDGVGVTSVSCNLPFWDHMLTLFAQHGLFDLELEADGDLEVDLHHTVEDVGIVLGQAITKALGEKRGICRYGNVTLPMDEALVNVTLDLCGRPYLGWHDSSFQGNSLKSDQLPQKLGDKIVGIDLGLVREFLKAAANNSGMALHVIIIAGENLHHLIEAIFKALGRALSVAVSAEPRRAGRIPSTKGTL